MKITRKQIEDLFEHTRSLRAQGRASWDIDARCRWSYFFVDSDANKLVSAGKHLEQLGYEFRGVLEPAPEDDDQETIFLRVDRVEQHTVESLLARNDELYAIARELEIASYDGMDCGAIDGP